MTNSGQLKELDLAEAQSFQWIPVEDKGLINAMGQIIEVWNANEQTTEKEDFLHARFKCLCICFVRKVLRTKTGCCHCRQQVPPNLCSTLADCYTSHGNPISSWQQLISSMMGRPKQIWACEKRGAIYLKCLEKMFSGS